MSIPAGIELLANNERWGISIFSGGKTTLRDNLITSNTAGGQGEGICGNTAAATTTCEVSK